MSATALQRVIVRMMFDPDFATAVYRNARHAIKTDEVTDEECTWLTQCDQRAYATDPHFAGRALHGLMGEYLVSGAVAVRHNEPLHRFFSSPRLHQCIQAGDSLALAFGDWIVHERRIRDSRVSQLAKLEHALAELRRRQIAPQTQGNTSAQQQPGLSPNVQLVNVSSGTMSLFTHLKAQIESLPTNPRDVALNSTINLNMSSLAMGREHLLLERKESSDISIEPLNAALADILGRAKSGASLETLQQTARGHGADPGEDREVIDDLIEDGLLVWN